MKVRDAETVRSPRLPTDARTRITWPPVATGRAVAWSPENVWPEAHELQLAPSTWHWNAAPDCELNSKVGLESTVANCAGVEPVRVVVGWTSTVMVAGAL